MSIDDLKRWHWIVIGTCLGLTLGYLQTVVGFDPLRAPPRALEQRRFEQELLQNIQGQPKLKDIRIYADGPLLLVKFQRLVPSGDGRTYVYGEWQLTPPVPYHPETGPRAEHAANYTVLNYLADVTEKHQAVHYRYAWWATKPMTVLLWTVGGLVIIGGIWPTVVNLLIGAGFGRAATTEPDYDLSRFQSEKDLLPASAGDDDAAKLRALEEEMLKNLEGSQQPTAPVTPAPLSPVVALNPPDSENALPDSIEEDKKYAGKFYPVTHGVPRPVPPGSAGGKAGLKGSSPP